MLSRKTLLAAGVATAALIGGGAALAQNMPAGTAPHAHHGIAHVIREEMSAGRISEREGTYLMQKIREARQERRAEREAYQQQQQDPSQAYGQPNR